MYFAIIGGGYSVVYITFYVLMRKCATMAAKLLIYTSLIQIAYHFLHSQKMDIMVVALLNSSLEVDREPPFRRSHAVPPISCALPRLHSRFDS